MESLGRALGGCGSHIGSRPELGTRMKPNLGAFQWMDRLGEEHSSGYVFPRALVS